MAFPKNIDYDKLVNHALIDIGQAVEGWLNGSPHDEVAFMNRVTEKLCRRRRGCDVGVQTPVTMRCELASLHRQGINQTDRYGADIAITIYVDDQQYVKTALFQFKKSRNYEIAIDRRQLLDATEDPRISSRSFALAIDEIRSGLRIETVETLLNNIPDGQNRKSFDCSEWEFLTQWMWKWFSCDLGPISDQYDRNSIEAELERFVVRDQNSGWNSPWSTSDEPTKLPDDYLPARVWMAFLFKSQYEQP